MRQLRFYIPFELLVGQTYQIPDEKARHLIHVLRLSIGAEIVLFNGDGKEYTSLIEEINKKSVFVKVISTTEKSCESHLQISLLQCISKGDRMDTTIQKSVELGVNQIYPLHSSRSNVKLDVKRMAKKQTHWRGIIHSACEQSGRNRVPELHTSNHFENTLSEFLGFSGLKLILSPIADLRFSDLSVEVSELALLVGPEGGFSDSELLLAKQAGFSAVSLGPRVLRTETAAMVALAAIQSKWGDI